MPLCAVGTSHRLTHEVRDRTSLLLGQHAQPPVHGVVEIELGPDHAMYIHRRARTVNRAVTASCSASPPL